MEGEEAFVEKGAARLIVCVALLNVAARLVDAAAVMAVRVPPRVIAEGSCRKGGFAVRRNADLLNARNIVLHAIGLHCTAMRRGEVCPLRAVQCGRGEGEGESNRRDAPHKKDCL